MEPTKKANARLGNISEGRIESPDGRWAFEYDAQQEPLLSSGRKLVYSGLFQERGSEQKLSCRALAFQPDCSGDYGAECATLGMLNALGVGPKLLATFHGSLGASAASANVILEEDAGMVLAKAIPGFSRSAGEPAKEPPLLHEVGTPERRVENEKILVDLFMQVHSTHDAGFFHRDLRCENVCIRRFGPEPADIKATVIDFDLGSGLTAGAPLARAPLFDILFHMIPSYLAGRDLKIAPTALELDMGYLAALSFHLAMGDLLLSSFKISNEAIDRFLDYLQGSITYFGYPSYITPVFSRRLEIDQDIAPLAHELGLVRVDGVSFPETSLLAEAKAFRRPFLDAEDRSIVEASTAGKLHSMIGELAKVKFESYKELRRSQGKPVEYENQEDQPVDLRDSNYAQVAHIPKKVEALGYQIVPLEDCPENLRVVGFRDDQIETLARIEHSRWIEERLAKGWTAGERNHEAKTTPYLVPYDELEDSIKEYDREAVRQMVPLLERAGFAIARPI